MGDIKLYIPKSLVLSTLIFLFLLGFVSGVVVSFWESDTRLVEKIRSLENTVNDSYSR